MRQKPVVAVLMAGIILLSGGVAFAATQTSGETHLAKRMLAAPWSSPVISVPPTTLGLAPASAAPSAAAVPTTAPVTTTPQASAPATTGNAATPAQPPITYTVKSGDTLSTIAEWFKLHGYQALYEANKAVIGNNPDLIFSGQQITIANGTLTMAQG
ncbi:MAG: LysM peptidoglycan-binding domain-containing protein [Actinomycetota bacterium]|nr:LysM peptidoglycan-binding domain-containing protein [Actinomycetota bacterium]